MDIDLASCLRGDKAAWDAFVARASPVIYSAVARTFARHAAAPREEDVQDAVQETFVRLVKDDYKLLRTHDAARSSLPTWLTLVARSAAIDALRRQGRVAEPLRDVPVAAPDPAEPVTIPPGLLTPRQELVMELLFGRGLEVSDAARTLGVDEQTVRSTRHKALSALRQHFGGDAAGPPPV